jgi:hypothetical protein
MNVVSHPQAVRDAVAQLDRTTFIIILGRAQTPGWPWGGRARTVGGEHLHGTAGGDAGRCTSHNTHVNDTGGSAGVRREEALQLLLSPARNTHACANLGRPCRNVVRAPQRPTRVGEAWRLPKGPG